MRLFLFDDEIENPIVGTVSIDLDYQAEIWVLDVAEGREGGTGRPIVAFMLRDDQGLRCIWTRSVEEAAAKKPPTITKVAERFTGEWQRTVEAVPVIEAIEPYEQLVLAWRKKS